MEEDSPETKEAAASGYADDTISTRMSRIHAWRESFTKEAPGTSAPAIRPWNRKIEPRLPGMACMAPSQPVSWREDPDTRGEATVSPNTVRASPRDGCSHPALQTRPVSGGQQTTFSLHACPACDAAFETSQSLRRHGRGPRADEACRVAVEYDFE
ncbi:hypothetical protein OE88DRAFT_1658683, partial [Heliocybe sulcata]